MTYMNISNFGGILVCCEELWICLNRDEFHYIPHYRLVLAYYKKYKQLDDEKSGAEFGKCRLDYCPFCGAILPESSYGTEDRDSELEYFSLHHFSNPKQHEGTIDPGSGKLLSKRCSLTKILEFSRE